MKPLTTPRLISRRLADDWELALSVFLGVLIATTLIAGAPIYLKALERQSIANAVDSAVERYSDTYLDISASVPFLPLKADMLQASDQVIADAAQRHISTFYAGRERHFRTTRYMMALPGPQPPSPSPNPGDGVQGVRPPVQGYLQHLSGLERHVRFLDGRMSSSVALRGTHGPMLEAVVSVEMAQAFGLGVGDVVVVTPSLQEPVRISARVVGILEPIDPSDSYWRGRVEDFLSPLLSEGDTERLALAPFVAQEALVQAVGVAYPSAQVSATWYVDVDEERLKSLSSSDMARRMSSLEGELAESLPGPTVLSGINPLAQEFERRSFLSSVPLLLLLAVMAITALYFLLMTVSQLAPSREGDVALLRSRGVGTWGLLKLYLLEGAFLTGISVVLAPFIAMSVVALVGLLPYFRNVTGGGMLPVELDWTPFVAAVGAGVLCLIIFVVPGVLAARSGVAAQKRSAARPPATPFFHRYYLDIGLLVVGGIVFWELHARGRLVSGGLFKEAQMNEALLLAPVLFLVAVALLFFRLFPLFVRFVSGESPALSHVLAGATLAFLAPAIAIRELLDGNLTSWLWPVALLAALALTYLMGVRGTGYGVRGDVTPDPVPRTLYPLLAVQAALVALFLWAEPPVPDSLMFIPSVALMMLVPVQVLFLLFRALAKRSPIWVSMTLWHMARNPLQYSWLVLLIVLASGVAFLSATVGGTLDRSLRERILYDVPTDVRVMGLGYYGGLNGDELREKYSRIPGAESVTLALRGEGSLSSSSSVAGFEVLALESRAFHPWYREDFSSRPLREVLQTLRPLDRVEPVVIPGGATKLGVWVKPQQPYILVYLWMVLQDSRGRLATVSFGNLEYRGWNLLIADIPNNLVPPLRLVAVQLYEPGFGATGTPGSLLLDDIHAIVGGDGEARLLEGFEGESSWTPIATSRVGADQLSLTADDVHGGRSAALFTFSKETNNSIRGIYQMPGGGPLPVAASSSFLASSGLNPGDVAVVMIEGTLVPIVVRDVVELFPTMDPGGGGFILAELDPLLEPLNVLSVTGDASPNEVFMAVAPGEARAVKAAVSELVKPTGVVMDRESLLESVSLDPLVTAGWRAMMLLSLFIAVFTVGLGYSIYLLALATRSRGEMGALQSLGLSRVQMLGLLGLEHLAIAAIGLGLGTWAGFQMSRLMVSSVAVTETGGDVLPPFILTIDWAFLAPIYAVLAIIFLATIFVLSRSMARLKLHTLSRQEV